MKLKPWMKMLFLNEIIVVIEKLIIEWIFQVLDENIGYN